jgi:aryl-alcohol dehydrogenase-like predicted oxidoreductase
MHQRTLGTHGPKVSAIGLGCMSMSQHYGTRDDAESIRAIHRALDVGITFFDTAAIYGNGHNETLVGRGLGARRKDVVLATKCGIVPASPGPGVDADGTPAGIVSSCDESLTRLGTDVIDLFYLHRVDPKVPIEESVGALASLVRAGKVRYIGLSEASPSTIRRAHAVHPIAALQSEYSLWYREPEQRALPACRELGIGFVPFSPIGRGFLAAAVKNPDTLSADDVRRRLPRFQGDNLQHNLALVATLEMLAARGPGPSGPGSTATPAQVALAWLLAKGSDIVPIPGTKRVKYVEENAAAADIALAAAEVAELEQTFRPDAPVGDRYNESMARLIDRS